MRQFNLILEHAFDTPLLLSQAQRAYWSLSLRLCKGQVQQMNKIVLNFWQVLRGILCHLDELCSVFHVVYGDEGGMKLFMFLLQYEDDEGDKVLLTTDSDLVGAISHARSLGLKVC